MILIEGNKVWLEVGDGDVHFAIKTVSMNGRENGLALTLMQGEPGNIGAIQDGRKHAIPEKFESTDKTPNMVTVKCKCVEALDVLIKNLIRLRKHEFPDAPEWMPGTEERGGQYENE